jgi:hypothetical protein
MDRHRHRRAQSCRLDDRERELRFRAVGERLGDDVIDACLGGPCDLLLEHRTTRLDALRDRGIVDVGVADVAREQRAGLGSDLFRDRKRALVERFELVLATDDPQLLAVRVVGERLDDVGPGVDEIAMDLRDDLRMVEHGFRHERAGLHVTAPLELEQVALGADHGPLGQTLEESPARAILSAAGARRAGLAGAPHTHGQWLLLAPNVRPFANRSSANGVSSAPRGCRPEASRPACRRRSS